MVIRQIIIKVENYFSSLWNFQEIGLENMKVLTAVILMLFASNCQGVDCKVVDCKFGTVNFGFLGSLYACEATGENTGNLTFIEELRGVHLSGKSHADVEAYREYGRLKSIPSNLNNFFPNLKGIYMYSQSSSPSANDLKPFSNLLWFSSNFGDLTSIDGDLFQHSKKLQGFEFHTIKLENVGENLLSGLNSLRRAKLTYNTCINFDADTPQKIEELKKMLLEQCPPLPQSTSTTTTTTTRPATTTEAQCSLPCSLNNDFDELKFEVAELRKDKTKQDGEIAELKAIIGKQDQTLIAIKSNIAIQDEIISSQQDRLIELEKMMREIGSRP